MVVSGIWNNFVKLGLPIVALGLLALSGGAGAAMAAAAIIGLVVLAAAIGLFALLLRSEPMAAGVGRAAGRVATALRRIVRQPPVDRLGRAGDGVPARHHRLAGAALGVDHGHRRSSATSRCTPCSSSPFVTSACPTPR